MDESARRDGAAYAVQDSFAFARRDNKDLVDVVGLFADLAAGCDAHDNDLAVRAGREDLPEVRVAHRSRDDVFIEGPAR